MTLKLALSLLAVLALACGMSVPASSGKTGSVNMPTYINTATNSASPTLSAESVFIVTADTLNVRPCAQDNDACPPLAYLSKGDVVMGGCVYFGDDIWLNFDNDKYAAVVFDGQVYMEGVC